MSTQKVGLTDLRAQFEKMKAAGWTAVCFSQQTIVGRAHQLIRFESPPRPGRQRRCFCPVNGLFLFKTGKNPARWEFDHNFYDDLGDSLSETLALPAKMITHLAVAADSGRLYECHRFQRRYRQVFLDVFDLTDPLANAKN
ncbi:MAG: hypothetical protein AAB511_00435 [Patescibacteria group bacterium]